MISNIMRKDLNARVPIIAGYENACQGQPVSCSILNTENAKARWNNNREERDRELEDRRCVQEIEGTTGRLDRVT
jgi:hypothetical protein